MSPLRGLNSPKRRLSPETSSERAERPACAQITPFLPANTRTARESSSAPGKISRYYHTWGSLVHDESSRQQRAATFHIERYLKARALIVKCTGCSRVCIYLALHQRSLPFILFLSVSPPVNLSLCPFSLFLSSPCVILSIYLPLAFSLALFHPQMYAQAIRRESVGVEKTRFLRSAFRLRKLVKPRD